MQLKAQRVQLFTLADIIFIFLYHHKVNKYVTKILENDKLLINNQNDGFP